MREATFDDGLLDGKVMEWNEEGKLTRREEYINGQRVVRNVSLYRPKRPSEEQFYLDGKLELDGEDQWWEAQPAAFSSKGQRTQHGPVRRWYENGQPKMQGQYKKDRRVGEFTWWHPNGSRKLKAGYQAGQKLGMWTWWHENGMKSIQGEYEAGQPVGVWTWWDENGKVDRQEDFAKRQRDNDGSSGELTEPSAAGTGDDSAPDSNDLQAPSNENEPAKLNDDASDPLPLLLDTDALEEINPLSDTPSPILDELSDDQ
jgi:antitoxin component YwqK of YwqJK toxin-antitoxin module